MAPKSALAEAANRVAAEFEYSAEDVNRAVEEFIREMGQTSNEIRSTAEEES